MTASVTGFLLVEGARPPVSGRLVHGRSYAVRPAGAYLPFGDLRLLDREREVGGRHTGRLVATGENGAVTRVLLRHYRITRQPWVEVTAEAVQLCLPSYFGKDTVWSIPKGQVRVLDDRVPAPAAPGSDQPWATTRPVPDRRPPNRPQPRPRVRPAGAGASGAVHCGPGPSVLVA
ncbi:MAG: hypothetical protein IPH27_10590 [Actinomycetales bacterium]|nr:hypothetical protein [Candidatus Phosphoribacter baldrii]